MKWERGDNYYLYTNLHTICRVNIGQDIHVELWDKQRNQRLASRIVHTREELKAAVEELKGLV